MEKNEIKMLEDKLNKEYANTGIIRIEEAHEEVLNIKKIEYVTNIMSYVKPSDNTEPIVVAKSFGEYMLIDGYHRLKYMLGSKEQALVIVLDDYKIKRNFDDLYTFIERQIGKTICFHDEYIFDVDGTYYEIQENEGCGGCSNGWSQFNLLKEVEGKKIKIESVDAKDDPDFGDVYHLYINDNMVAEVNTGWGNGYYGGDFDIVRQILINNNDEQA